MSRARLALSDDFSQVVKQHREAKGFIAHLGKCPVLSSPVFLKNVVAVMLIRSRDAHVTRSGYPGRLNTIRRINPSIIYHWADWINLQRGLQGVIQH